MFTSYLASWAGAGFCSGATSGIVDEEDIPGKAEPSVREGAGAVSGNPEASGWREVGFACAGVDVSAWPVGD
jgi:hypothetical protein